MITVTFDNKLTEQFENYGDVLKWISDELTATSTSDYSDPRVKLELLTQEEVQFLADDQKGIWSDVLYKYSHFDYIVYCGKFYFLDVIVGSIVNINSCTYTDVVSCLEDCGILDLFDITED